jgi:ABC-2 type transport system permease protein
MLKDYKYFTLYTLTDLIINLASITGIWLLAARFNGIGGMNINQVLFMLGYSLAVSGAINTFFSYNVFFISRVIGRGQLDHILIMPQPVWLTLLTEGFIPVSGSGVLLSGFGIMLYALIKLELITHPLFLAGVIVCWLFSIVISFSFSLLWGSLAFYAPVAAEEVCTSVEDFFSSLKNFPLNGLGTLGKTVLLSVLPVGLYAWFPTAALLGLSGRFNIALMALIAAVYLGLAGLVFRRGLQHYVKCGSSRYLDRGHRR